MNLTNSLATEAGQRLRAKYGSLWQAAQAFNPYDSQFSGAWLHRQLMAIPADPDVAQFVQQQVGIDLTSSPEYKQASA